MRGHSLLRPLMRGLVVVLPITFTVFILYWLITTLDNLFGAWLKALLGSAWVTEHLTWGRNLYFPGMGLIVGLLVVLVVGVFFETWIVRTFIGLAEDLLERLPLVKSIYGSFRDLAGFFSASRQRKASQVVVVNLPGGSGRVVGLMTREDLSDLPREAAPAGAVAVYIPFSYMLGGITMLVPRAHVQPVDMSMEEAMRFAITAGMSTGTGDAADEAETRAKSGDKTTGES